ncbi:MAG: D-alanyl-D-alanine carboxypeptidase family protein [bacterium]|nr:D-alanyl-D-alanine carboxypeptidase family protein [bacterium]
MITNHFARFKALSGSISVIVFLFIGLFPSTASALCCKCIREQAPDKTLCLQTAKKACSDIDQKKLGVVCTGELSETQCQSIDSNASAVCFENPVQVDTIEQIKTEEEAKTVKTITTPTLNVPIPGLDFAAKIVERGGYIVFPFLAQYVYAVYKWLLGATIVAAAIMIMYGGFKYLMASTGAKVESGKKIIVDAIVGIVLVFGAYTILQVVNPSALTPSSIRLRNIPYQAYFEEEEGNDPASVQGGTVSMPPAPGSQSTANLSFKLPVAVCSGLACKSLCDGCAPKADLPPPPANIATSKDLVVIPSSPGLQGSGTLRPQAMEALVAAGKVAQGWQGGPYIIKIIDSTRPFHAQVTIACKAFCNNEGNKVGVTIAQPGGSKHGSGIAVDIVLMRGSKMLTTCCTSKTQTKTISEENGKILFDIMSSVGWVRLCNEAWHFEWGTKGTSCRCDNFKWPPKC